MEKKKSVDRPKGNCPWCKPSENSQTENVYNTMDWGFSKGVAIPQLEEATTHVIVNGGRSDWSAQCQEQADFTG